MKIRKILSTVAVAVCLSTLVLNISAQTKKRTTRKSTRSAAASAKATSAANAAEVKASAEKVSAQIVNVSRFLYLLGGIAQTIQDVDASAKAGRASSTTVATNNNNKKVVVTTIGNLRAGLAELESEFQAKPALLPYYSQIQGISDITASAEDQANNGQFVNSGKTLLQVVEKLSNTLVAMP